MCLRDRSRQVEEGQERTCVHHLRGGGRWEGKKERSAHAVAVPYRRGERGKEERGGGGAHIYSRSREKGREKGEERTCVRDLFELFLRLLLVGRVLIRVPNDRKLSKCLLDRSLVGRSRHAEDLICIAAGRVRVTGQRAEVRGREGEEGQQGGRGKGLQGRGAGGKG